MNDAIEILVGRRVKIWSNPTGSGDCNDSGILESYDYPWVRLRRGKTEVLCFSAYNIRLVQALDPVEITVPPPGEVLLRPATAQE